MDNPNFLLATDEESKGIAMQWRVEWENARMKAESAQIDSHLTVDKHGRRVWRWHDDAVNVDVPCSSVGFNQRNRCDTMPHCEWNNVLFSLGSCVDSTSYLRDVCDQLKATRNSVPRLPVRGLLMAAVNQGDDTITHIAEDLILDYQRGLVSYDDMLAAVYMASHLQIERTSVTTRNKVQHVLATYGRLKIPLRLKLDIADKILARKPRRDSSRKKPRRDSSRKKPRDSSRKKRSTSKHSWASALLVGALMMLPSVGATGITQVGAIAPATQGAAVVPDGRGAAVVPDGRDAAPAPNESALTEHNVLHGQAHVSGLEGNASLASVEEELSSLSQYLNDSTSLEDDLFTLAIDRVDKKIPLWEKVNSHLEDGDYGGSPYLRSWVAKLTIAEMLRNDAAVHISNLLLNDQSAFQTMQTNYNYAHRIGMEDQMFKSLLELGSVLYRDHLKRTITTRVRDIWHHMQSNHPYFASWVRYDISGDIVDTLIDLAMTKVSKRESYSSTREAVRAAFSEFASEHKTPSATKHVLLAAMMPDVTTALSSWTTSVGTIILQNGFTELLNKTWRDLGGEEEGSNWIDLTQKDIAFLVFTANNKADITETGKFVYRLLLFWRSFNNIPWQRFIGSILVLRVIYGFLLELYNQAEDRIFERDKDITTMYICGGLEDCQQFQLPKPIEDLVFKYELFTWDTAIRYALKALSNMNKDKACIWASSTLLKYCVRREVIHFVHISGKDMNYNPSDIAAWAQTCHRPVLAMYLGIDSTIESHANMIVINRTRKLIEHFEPHGSKFPNLDEEAYAIFLITVEDFFTIAFPNYTYVPPMKLCPALYLSTSGPSKGTYKGMQSLQDDVKVPGSCTIWSYWYLHMRIKYHEEEPAATMTRAIRMTIGEGDRHQRLNRCQTIVSNAYNICHNPLDPLFYLCSPECATERQRRKRAQRLDDFIVEFVKHIMAASNLRAVERVSKNGTKMVCLIAPDGEEECWPTKTIQELIITLNS